MQARTATWRAGGHGQVALVEGGGVLLAVLQQLVGDGHEAALLGRGVTVSTIPIKFSRELASRSSPNGPPTTAVTPLGAPPAAPA